MTVKAQNSQSPHSQCNEKWRRATAHLISHSLDGYNFSTFVQFLSEGLQDFGKDYHIEKSIRAQLHLIHSPSICVRASDRVVFTLHSRLGSKVIRDHSPFGSNHVDMQLWARTLHNLGRTQMSASKEIATCSYQLGHGHLRLKSRTRTQISVNTKHHFSCFDCIRARTQRLGGRSWM